MSLYVKNVQAVVYDATSLSIVNHLYMILPLKNENLVFVDNGKFL